jgi:hypothetical protein
MKIIAAATVLVACAAIVAAAQNPMRPGRWEVSIQMEMPNMPPMPPMKSTQCVTQAQLDSPDKALPGGPAANACKISDYKVSGNTVTWKMACSDPEPMTGTGEMRFDGKDAYDGVITMNMGQQDVTMKSSGKRLGDCTP